MVAQMLEIVANFVQVMPTISQTEKAQGRLKKKAALDIGTDGMFTAGAYLFNIPYKH